ncbi:sugar phosphate isomerase/epimerase family protein [Roseomonas populi]|uniref:Sugar phosphate isomerase/epimerase n=1 Tax=Roseomonas populi TaxID=3121582 RepID=A0ABT1X6Z0_9PROT|nr:sugar phosphate isomerase/epimerase family protein [Roseomonas pecuniae]MCR0983863.1 sugar phosphate isomerase/epimerase [Roseomonas pecuniae]
MIPGIDSYCFHRYFGDAYPGLETDPGERLDVWGFLDRALELGAQGVSLEACYLPADDPFLDRLRERLDTNGLQRVWAWGHPNGLGSGTRSEAVEDLARHLAAARRVGAGVMRICCGGRRTRPADWPSHRDALLPLLRSLLPVAEAQGVVMAIENHLDLFSEELVELLERVDSAWLGVCLDTANNVRLGEDPLVVVRRLAPWTRATHLKDVAPLAGAGDAFTSWPSVPLGHGVVDVAAVVQLLRGAGYDGLLAVEIDYLHPLHGTDERAALRTSMQVLRESLAKSRPLTG